MKKTVEMVALSTSESEDDGVVAEALARHLREKQAVVDPVATLKRATEALIECENKNALKVVGTT